MKNNAVSNTGPILHLNEINLLNVLDIFSNVLIPEEVNSELRKRRVLISKKIKIVNLESKYRDVVKIFTNQGDLDLGESEAIALSLQEKTGYFLTDDLDARQVAKEYNLDVHGTVGIILRAFREKIIDGKTAVDKISELKVKSSLFITQDLIDEISREIKDFINRR